MRATGIRTRALPFKLKVTFVELLWAVVVSFMSAGYFCNAAKAGINMLLTPRSSSRAMGPEADSGKLHQLHRLPCVNLSKGRWCWIHLVLERALPGSLGSEMKSWLFFWIAWGSLALNRSCLLHCPTPRPYMGASQPSMSFSPPYSTSKTGADRGPLARAMASRIRTLFAL